MTHQPSLVTCLTLGLGLSLSTAAFSAPVTIVNDTFDVGATPTIGNDLDDPNDIAWVGGFNNASVTVGSILTSPGSGNYLLNEITSGQGFSMIRGALPTDSNLSPAIGETLSLTFDFSYSSGSDTNTNGFRFGLFDSTGIGTVVQAGVGSGNTTLAIVHDTTAGIDANMGSGTGGGDAFTGPSDVVSNGTMSSGLDNSSPYDAYSASLSITRVNATTVSISASLNGGTATVIDVDDVGDAADYLTNFSGGYIVIRNGSPRHNFLVDNVNVALIPEPASLALMGLGGLLMLGGRRRIA